MNDIAARYLACWNETDPAARRTLIDQVWAGDASYIDPLAEAYGRDAIDATIATTRSAPSSDSSTRCPPDRPETGP